ncbi:MAG: hypothetical protein EOR81_01605 [Mesorhizobium sp.]|nr:MAG: hypothetical protein EOR81_01605 [Mesorhizobium sp.]
MNWDATKASQSSYSNACFQHYDSSRNDSFGGLPNASAEDGHASAHKGDMAGSLFFTQGWFEDTLPTQLQDEIAFANLDGDLYDSVKVSLELCILAYQRALHV